MQQQILLLVDDLDASKVSHTQTKTAIQTVPFSLDGESYEIDLTDKHATELRKVLQEYIPHARRSAGVNGTGNGTKANGTRRARGRAPEPPARSPRRSNAPVREWARSQGIEIKDRGRIAPDVLARFRAANGSAA